jgi:hypothetical protein
MCQTTFPNVWACNATIINGQERPCLQASATPSKLPNEEQSNDTLGEEIPKTTLMLCNLPNHYSRSMVMDMLRSEGFGDHVELIYVPMNLAEIQNFGYAFVSLDSPGAALQCREKMQHFTRWIGAGEKRMEIEWSETQGLQANIERYRNSPLMHESVQDELRPGLFRRGVRISFPEPTKSIRAPRLRPRRSNHQGYQNNQRRI